jgi:hypothetical protein
MKIYYSRTVDTNDGINGSALQKFFEHSGLINKAELIRYEKQPVYSFDKLDSADMMIIGYCEDRHDLDGKYKIGKGVFEEMQRAYKNGTPIFFLNLSNDKIPYLEQIKFCVDVTIIDAHDYKNFAVINIYYTAQQIDDVEYRMCAYEHYSQEHIRAYLKEFDVDLSKLLLQPSPQVSTVKYDPVTFQEIETSPSLLLLRRK